MIDDLIEPFVAATSSVFATMVGWEVTPGTPGTFEAQREYDLTSLIGLSGASTGVVMVHWAQSTALKAVGAMLGSEPAEVNADVIDTLGELTNMVAGSAKASLSPMFSNLALPIVLFGKNRELGMPKYIQPIRIPFDSPCGPFSLELDIKPPDARQ